MVFVFIFISFFFCWDDFARHTPSQWRQCPKGRICPCMVMAWAEAEEQGNRSSELSWGLMYPRDACWPHLKGRGQEAREEKPGG